VLIQLLRAKAPGVRVIATASGTERQDWVKQMGAHDVVDHHSDLAEQVLALVPGGVDWMFTSYSVGMFETFAKIMKPFGQIVGIDDGVFDVAPLKLKSIAWHWELMFTTPLFLPESTHQHEVLEQISALADDGKITPTTTQVLSPMSAETIRQAHQMIETAHTKGKIVISVATVDD
jgi:NADPH:quinone reductase-like Zn-dependent oxidoreductase